MADYNSLLMPDWEVEAAHQLAAGRHRDPFAFLGPHPCEDGFVVRTFLPGAEKVEVVEEACAPRVMRRAGNEGLFFAKLDRRERPSPCSYFYRIHWHGAVKETEDAYAFGPILTDFDLYLFAEGTHWDLSERLGASVDEIESVNGVRFSVWAPNAQRVSVVGEFNAWDGRRHPMRLRHKAGVWEIFIPRVQAGCRYKYEIVGPDGVLLPLKADPLARETERPPATASIVAYPTSTFTWTDSEWMAQRAKAQDHSAPVTIYEVHPASWLRPEGAPDLTLGWRLLAERLIPYVKGLGFTHIELLPIMEHPFGGSWGYQPLSQFAPSARFGTPTGFATFVNACHNAGLGVILDWVPAHFPNDAHGLAHFDGAALYEYSDPREGFHKDWNTLIYDFGRREVQGFLIASAMFWLKRFHIDGLRVDAVASMLYRDYSRREGEWIPNRYGGRENIEAIEFLRRLNETVANHAPGAITIAEESTAFPGVTVSSDQGGLGFSYKWNMGWMHDTLSYIEKDPIYRAYEHGKMTFGLVYAFSEHFILPLSHDEVVYGKGSLYIKVPGDHWQKLATLRAYYAFMWTHPGKKLLFMGSEFGQHHEWSHDGELQWDLLKDAGHSGLQRVIRDLNRLYAESRTLHSTDSDPAGFRWVIGDDARDSVYVYERRGTDGKVLIIAMNMTPVPRAGFSVGAALAGTWREIVNTDSAYYGGSNLGNGERVITEPVAAHGCGQSLLLVLPPLATIILAYGD